jgi:hypothetical protein
MDSQKFAEKVLQRAKQRLRTEGWYSPERLACPSDEELSLYAEGRFPFWQWLFVLRLCEHISECSYCQKTVIYLRETQNLPLSSSPEEYPFPFGLSTVLKKTSRTFWLPGVAIATAIVLIGLLVWTRQPHFTPFQAIQLAQAYSRNPLSHLNHLFTSIPQSEPSGFGFASGVPSPTPQRVAFTLGVLFVDEHFYREEEPDRLKEQTSRLWASLGDPTPPLTLWQKKLYQMGYGWHFQSGFLAETTRLSLLENWDLAPLERPWKHWSNTIPPEEVSNPYIQQLLRILPDAIPRPKDPQINQQMVSLLTDWIRSNSQFRPPSR